MGNLPFIFVGDRAILDRRFQFHYELLSEATGRGDAAAFDEWLRASGAQLGRVHIQGDSVVGFELYARDGLAFKKRDESVGGPETWLEAEEQETVLTRCEAALRIALRREHADPGALLDDTRKSADTS